MKAKLTSGQRNRIARDLIAGTGEYCEDFIAAKTAQARKYGITEEEVQAIYVSYHDRLFARRVAEARAKHAAA